MQGDTGTLIGVREWNLPLPHQMASPFFVSSFIKVVLYCSQWVRMAGNRNLLWCTALYIEMPMYLSTKSTLLTDAPAIRVAKLSRIFPAGYRPSTMAETSTQVTLDCTFCNSQSPSPWSRSYSWKPRAPLFCS